MSTGDSNPRPINPLVKAVRDDIAEEERDRRRR